MLKRPTDTVARLGGDEFAILLPGDDAAKAERVAKALLHTLDMPMTPEGHVVDVRASIGIAVYPEHGSERSTLLRHADAAMYAAKRRNLGIALWDERYDLHSRERLSLMSGLRKAVDEDELVLFYQPKVALRGGSELHAEALVRWQHPTRGLVAPVQVRRFAEQTGTYARSRSGDGTRSPTRLGAATPADEHRSAFRRDLVDLRLPDRVRRCQSTAARRSGSRWKSPKRDSRRSDHAIDGLRSCALGCRLAIDAYGTGYRPSHLRRLPVHD